MTGNFRFGNFRNLIFYQNEGNCSRNTTRITKGLRRVGRTVKMSIFQKFSRNYDFCHVTLLQKIFRYDFPKEHTKIHWTARFLSQKYHFEKSRILYMSIPSHGRIDNLPKYLSSTSLLSSTLNVNFELGGNPNIILKDQYKQDLNFFKSG